MDNPRTQPALLTLINGTVDTRSRWSEPAEASVRSTPRWRQALAAILMLALGLWTPFFVVHQMTSEAQITAKSRFDRLSDRLIHEVQERMARPVFGLTG